MTTGLRYKKLHNENNAVFNWMAVHRREIL